MMKLLVNKLFGKFAIFALIVFTSMSIASAKIKVVSTFSILGDMVQNIGGNNIELTTLVGANGDGHVYEPTPADAKSVAAADVVFVNGTPFWGTPCLLWGFSRCKVSSIKKRLLWGTWPV